jgi:hypothetical protein
LAVTAAVPAIVNVHVFVLFPPLEHAPDQTASRPFETLSVIEVPVVNDPDPELPTATLMPAGLDVTRSPLLPVALTVSVAVSPGGELCGANGLAAENGPATPAELRARTRHHRGCAGRPPMEACESVTVALATNGDEIVAVSSIWIS